MADIVVSLGRARTIGNQRSASVVPAPSCGGHAVCWAAASRRPERPCRQNRSGSGS
ncbi:Uncharacterised protein [Bordetella pertussis]|nr:Uncharacterised protein [Bordetella pertussis]